MKSLVRIFLVLMSIALTQTSVWGQLKCQPVTNPVDVKFSYVDLENFIEALNKLKTDPDSTGVIQELYVNRASEGLLEFLRENEVEATDYVKLMRKYPQRFNHLEKLPFFLNSEESKIKETLLRMSETIAEPVFLPVYYMVGFYDGLHGEPSPYGILLAYGDSGENPRSPANTIVHEMVHVQQALTVGLEEYQSVYSTKRSLLSLAIREGTARFLTELITGEISNKQAYDYYIKHEKKLISKFLKERNDTTAGEWMWSKPSDPDQPQQVGYVLGSMIIKSYYDKADNKNLAIAKILSVTDYRAFFEESGFGQ